MAKQICICEAVPWAFVPLTVGDRHRSGDQLCAMSFPGWHPLVFFYPLHGPASCNHTAAVQLSDLVRLQCEESMYWTPAVSWTHAYQDKHPAIPFCLATLKWNWPSEWRAGLFSLCNLTVSSCWHLKGGQKDWEQDFQMT